MATFFSQEKQQEQQQQPTNLPHPPSPSSSHQHPSTLDKALRPLIDNSPVINSRYPHHDLCDTTDDIPHNYHPLNIPPSHHRGQVSPKLHFDVSSGSGSSPPGGVLMKPLSLTAEKEKELFMGGVEGVKGDLGKEEDHFLGEEQKTAVRGDFDGLSGTFDGDIVENDKPTGSVPLTDSDEVPLKEKQQRT